MLSFRKLKGRGDLPWNLFKLSAPKPSPVPILKQLAKDFGKEFILRIKHANSFAGTLHLAEAIHAATDNLGNTKLAVEKALRGNDLLTGESVLSLLDEQIEKTKAILQIEIVSLSSQATEIGVRTLNLLFCAKQIVKQKFSLITQGVSITNYDGKSIDETTGTLLSSVAGNAEPPRVIISSTLLYQLHHSLFPAERMLIGAGRRKGKDIEIDGIFDVTGNASSGYVKADATRLGRALIVMSETERYFALWIHSHPGKGKDMTYPSSTDLNQEAEWLKDYSPNLVNAIVVEDRFVRLWGKALDEGRVQIEIVGIGIRKVSGSEPLYRLEF